MKTNEYGIKKFIIFMIVAYISAFCFEEIPRILFIKCFNHPSMKHLWEIPGIIFFFPVWYGAIFMIFFFLFYNKSLKLPVLSGVLLGMTAEKFLFKEMNIVSFFLFPIFYGGMFYIPFKVINVKSI